MCMVYLSVFRLECVLLKQEIIDIHGKEALHFQSLIYFLYSTHHQVLLIIAPQTSFTLP